MQTEKFLKINKHAGWNKSVQDGKFQKINKICCTIIRETKVVYDDVPLKVSRNPLRKFIMTLEYFEFLLIHSEIP